MVGSFLMMLAAVLSLAGLYLLRESHLTWPAQGIKAGAVGGSHVEKGRVRVWQTISPTTI